MFLQSTASARSFCDYEIHPIVLYVNCNMLVQSVEFQAHRCYEDHLSQVRSSLRLLLTESTHRLAFRDRQRASCWPRRMGMSFTADYILELRSMRHPLSSSSSLTFGTAFGTVNKSSTDHTERRNSQDTWATRTRI